MQIPCGDSGWVDASQPPLPLGCVSAGAECAVGLGMLMVVQSLELFVCNPCLQGIWQGSLLNGTEISTLSFGLCKIWKCAS